MCETVLSKTTEECGSRFFASVGILNSLSEFQYEPDNGITFPAYFRRYETIFMKRYKQWSNEEKITVTSKIRHRGERLIHEPNFTKKAGGNLGRGDNKDFFMKFRRAGQLFHSRYKCLNIVKQKNEYLVTCNVNFQCVLFKLGDLSIDMFNCLILVQGFTGAKDKDIRSRIMTIMEQDPEIMQQKVTEECKRLINVKRDYTWIK